MPKIKKLKLAALIGIILLVCFVFIGLPLIGHAWRKNHPDTYPSVVPASQWKFFASEEGRFRILFPGKPESTNEVMGNAVEEITLHTFYVWANNQTEYAANFGDYPKNVKNLSPLQIFDISQNGVKEKIGKIVAQRDFKFGNYPARDFEFAVGGKGNFSGQIRYILVDQRLYQIMVMFLTKNPHRDDFKIFFDSFSLSKEVKQ
jgi:hypothetical protein